MEKVITKIVDGSTVSDEVVKKFHLRPFCSLNDAGEYISKFVGVVMNRTETLVSCPKHLGYQHEDDINLILGCLMKSSQYLGMNNVDILDSNIPYVPYLFVLDYYQRYGLYRETLNTYSKSYDGNVDWRRTSRDCEKIVSGSNLLFLPLVVKNTIQKDTFIGQCMKYVINDGYEHFGKYVGRGEVIDGSSLDVKDDNIDVIIDKLQNEKNIHFKDLELQLIDALIQYLQWKGSFVENSYFVTKSFENVWEVMVNTFLTENYESYDHINNKMNIVRGCKKHLFVKKQEYIQSHEKIKENGLNHFVEYDHYCKENNVIMMFDSKYYNEIREVNYKQIAYHYFLKNRKRENEVPEKIINGLIIPHEEEYFSKIHIDRTDIDGVLIVEHYLNLRSVMKSYL